jgi:magnesium transporter
VAAASELAAAPRWRRIADIMTPALFTTASTGLDELREFFEAHPIAAVPVVDERGRLLGVTRRTAVLDAINLRAEREMLRMRGIVGGDEVRSLPTVTRSRRRLSWLSINIGLNIVAASVIAVFIDTLDQVIALAVFLPIISDMSGASGNQAVAVSMRELSLGLVKPYEVIRTWLKEISVGLINGVALGLLIGAVATVWDGNPWLGLVVGVTLALNTLIAVSVGGTVPLVLKRLGVDPAVASGPILTTVTDICGFFLALSLASLLLARLL